MVRVRVGADGVRIVLLVLVASFAVFALFGGVARADPTITEFSAGITANSGPRDITAGPDGNVWFTESGAGQIGRVTPNQAVTEFSSGITHAPFDITAGPDGNVWFTEFGSSKIGRITPVGVVTELSTGIAASSQPSGITVGPDGNLWFTEYAPGADKIGRITPAGVVTEFVTDTDPSNQQFNITAGPDGNLWFTIYNGHGTNKIGRITPAGVVTEFPLGLVQPGDIVAGPDGNLWFTSDGIGRITPAGLVTVFSAGITSNGAPSGITAGPDGNLWFVEGNFQSGANRIGRITPAGAVTEFVADNNYGHALVDVTSGADGNLWFTTATNQLATDNNGLGRVNLAADAAPVNTDPPKVPASAEVGQSISCSTGQWSGAVPQTYVFTWLRDGTTVVSGPNAQSGYTVVAADNNHRLVCRVTATNARGSTDKSSLSVHVGTLPAVTTGAFSNLTPNSVTLGGLVNPEGASVSDCQFVLTASLFGVNLPCEQTVGSGSAPVSVSATATGLAPGTTYTYLLAATTTVGTNRGQDATFTTPGASAPTATTNDAQYAFGNPTATLNGLVNAHNDPTTFQFYYGTSSVAASLPEDLQGYPSVTAPQPAGGGTSDVSVSAQIANVRPGTTYYYRLAATNKYGTGIGTEQSFKITVPAPSNTVAPYLQQRGGFDAARGYDLKCVPNQWANFNGSYAIYWVYIAQDNAGNVISGHVRSAAAGTVSTDTYPGDIYHVSSVDANKAVACLVAPYALDGSLAYDSRALSDSIVPLAPEFAPVPEWIKQAWKLYDKGSTVYDSYSGALECVEFAAVPGLGEGLCAVIAAHVIAGIYYGNLVDRSFGDPPDPSYRTIALPPPPRRASHGTSCAPRTARRECARLKRAARRYASASGTVGSLFEALATARNRFLVARTAHDPDSQLAQATARKAYSGLLAAALQAQQQSGLAYAQELRRAHINAKTSSSVLHRIAKRRATTILRAPLVRRLLAAGYSKAELESARAFFALRRPPHGFSLRRFLTLPPPPIPFARDYNSMRLDDLTALLTAFTRQGILPASAAAALFGDIDHARAACTAAARATALQQLLQAAAPNLPPTYRDFLRTAIQPLMRGQSTADPLPHC